MKYKYLIAACFGIFLPLLIMHSVDFNPLATIEAETKFELQPVCAEIYGSEKFLSVLAEHSPPDWWCEQYKKDAKQFPVFRLSQVYPENTTPENYSWLDKKFDSLICTDFESKDTKCEKDATKRWQMANEYMIEILKYTYQGNLENDWVVQNNTVRKWFHAPWLHASMPSSSSCKLNKGREFIHGLTPERCSNKRELSGKKDFNVYQDPDRRPKEFSTPMPCPQLTEDVCTSAEYQIQNWGVAYFNEPGGEIVGKVWDEMTVNEIDSNRYPNPAKFKEMDFRNGTAIVKLLFTNATDEEAPFLKGSQAKWRADVTRSRDCDIHNFDKCFPVTRLLQIDIAVRDTRADPFTGWVFGTFVYDKDAENIFNDKQDRQGWEKLIPLGIMFGNDPTVPLNGGYENLRESIINKKVYAKQHLGCGGRLVGPVDNPKSSCISCHSQAEVRSDFAKIIYKAQSCDQEPLWARTEDREYWFKNVKPTETFSPMPYADNIVYYPLHNVLQLQIGIARFCKEPGRCVKREMSQMETNVVNSSSMEQVSRGNR